jgi:hypothetical protein
LNDHVGRAELSAVAAATLLQDAAAIEMIMGDYLQARGNLQTAGDLFLRQGVATGFLLLSLSGRRVDEDRVLEFLRTERDESHDSEKDLALYLSLMVTNAKTRGLRDILFDRFKLELERRMLSAPWVYATLAERLSGGDASGSAPIVRQIAFDRLLMLQMQMADKYHWHLVSQPTDLVDFNLTALALIELQADGDAAFLNEAFGTLGPAVGFPISAARGLVSAWDRSK